MVICCIILHISALYLKYYLFPLSYHPFGLLKISYFSPISITYVLPSVRLYEYHLNQATSGIVAGDAKPLTLMRLEADDAAEPDGDFVSLGSTTSNGSEEQTILAWMLANMPLIIGNYIKNNLWRLVIITS